MGAEEKVNILLVDDQPAKLLAYEAILSELGENLVMASSAREALEHLLKIEVAVVLIDVVMPEFDGFQLAAMIREHPRFQTLSIIFVSAVQVTDLDLLRGYECGAVDYVPVPVAPELLRSKVRVFCELFRKTRQLEVLNAELEHRVAERTAELAHANTDLEHRVEERTREREAALAQVHEMQKVESLGQLTGGVAHDFNNLLMAVLGNLCLVSKYAADNPKIIRLVDGAIKAAERGANLTKRMLAFARRQELKPEIIDVPKLVGGTVEMLRHSLGPEIEIVTEFRREALTTRVDPNQLELALLNLALNARDAMPDGGKLAITARREIVGAGDVPGLAAGEYICIDECDNGAGMDEATLARAAEPFFTTKGAGAGTGLGLSMVDGLVAQSGGAMRIKSQLGAGTTIELWLPIWLGEDAKSSATPRRRRSPQRSSLQVLLVEDDEMVAAGTLAMLEDLGHTTIEANSAAVALEILAAHNDIDIVVTDHAMPGMNGTELARRIRNSWPELPVVLVTGYADPPNGFDPLLPRLAKPYRQQELGDLISALGADHRQKSCLLSEQQPAAE
ncbi:MAG TPA: response regulator [Stellaceae bacterium]|jgi:signal transduction histidine kinase|nr:response regulator [Stellaceae bacterium]